MKKKLISILITTCMIFSFAACSTDSNAGSPSADPTDAVNPTEEPTATSTPSVSEKDLTAIAGTIKVAVPDWQIDAENKRLIDGGFTELYPNINIELVPWNNSLNEWITAQAAIDDLPDVAIYNWESIPYLVSQGLLYPLNDLYANDPEAQYIIPALKEKYNYNGKYFAVPYNVAIRTVGINLDMLNELNADVPSANWTFDQFKELSQKATSDTTSGINYIDWYEEVFSCAFAPAGKGPWGYDYATGKFNFTDGNFEQAIKAIRDLKGVPGLISDDLKNSELVDNGEVDDYGKKFGENADGIALGKILITTAATWDWSWFKNYTFSKDLYSIPTLDGSMKVTCYSDASFIINGTESPEAAYEALKWFTFGEKGYEAHINWELNDDLDSEGNHAPSLWLPASTNPNSIALFNSLEYVPNGLKELYSKMDTAVIGDLGKYVPGWNDVYNAELSSVIQSCLTGESDPAAVSSELEQKVNDAIKIYQDEFNANFQKHYQ